MGIADTLPIYHAGDNGLVDSDTKKRAYTNLTVYFDINEGIEGTLISKFLLCNNFWNKNISANAVLEADTASTPNLLHDYLSKISMDSVCISHFAGTKSLSTSQLLPKLLNESIEPHSANHGLQDFILVDPPIFITWLPGGSAKTRPPGHRRGPPSGISCEHSRQK